MFALLVLGAAEALNNAESELVAGDASEDMVPAASAYKKYDKYYGGGGNKYHGKKKHYH